MIYLDAETFELERLVASDDEIEEGKDEDPLVEDENCIDFITNHT